MPTPTAPGAVLPPTTISVSAADLGHWLVLLLVAALAGLVVELLRGGAGPLGWVGGLAAALVGTWLGAELIASRVAIAPQFALDGVALVPAALGGLVVAFVVSLLGGARRQGYY